MRDVAKIFRVIQEGNIVQLEKFLEKDKADCFEQYTLEMYLFWLREEYLETITELNSLISSINKYPTPYQDKRIKEKMIKTQREAADLGNFCDMLIYRINRYLEDFDG